MGAPDTLQYDPMMEVADRSYNTGQALMFVLAWLRGNNLLIPRWINVLKGLSVLKAIWPYLPDSFVKSTFEWDNSYNLWAS